MEASSCQCQVNQEVAPFALGRAREAGPREDLAEPFKQLFYGRKFKLTTTNSKLKPGVKGSYGLLPFRALEDHCLPAAIQQRWETSVAASKSAEWRLWFRNLNPKQQKSVVQHLSKITKDKFWAGLWLEYEEWSKPRRTRHVAAAARAQVILERESMKEQMEELKCPRPVAHICSLRLPFKLPLPHFQRIRPLLHPDRILPAACPEPLSAPMTPQTIASLRLRLAPSYFRLPNHALHFATQIFRCKSYEEAVAEQKANFNSWVREAKTIRVEGMPGYVVCGRRVVHEDDVPKFTTKKKWLPTGKRGCRKKKWLVSKFKEEKGC